MLNLSFGHKSLQFGREKLDGKKPDGGELAVRYLFVNEALNVKKKKILCHRNSVVQLRQVSSYRSLHTVYCFFQFARSPGLGGAIFKVCRELRRGDTLPTLAACQRLEPFTKEADEV